MLDRARPCRAADLKARGLSDEELDHREALYLRLLNPLPRDCVIAQQLHRYLCEVRLAQFERS